MKLLARLFRSLSNYFESRAIAGKLAHRIEVVEAQNAQLRRDMDQLKLDMGKCKLIVGLNQVMDVTA